MRLLIELYLSIRSFLHSRTYENWFYYDFISITTKFLGSFMWFLEMKRTPSIGLMITLILWRPIQNTTPTICYQQNTILTKHVKNKSIWEYFLFYIQYMNVSANIKSFLSNLKYFFCVEMSLGLPKLTENTGRFMLKDL